jgi:5,10-methylenetetrahydrofolate reductase
LQRIRKRNPEAPSAEFDLDKLENARSYAGCDAARSPQFFYDNELFLRISRHVRREGA